MEFKLIGGRQIMARVADRHAVVMSEWTWHCTTGFSTGPLVITARMAWGLYVGFCVVSRWGSEGGNMLDGPAFHEVNSLYGTGPEGAFHSSEATVFLSAGTLRDGCAVVTDRRAVVTTTAGGGWVSVALYSG